MKTPLAIAVAASLMILSITIVRAEPPTNAPTRPPTTRPATKPASRPATKPATTRASGRATTEPTTRRAASMPSGASRKSPETKAAEDAIRAAVLALTKEGQDAVRKKSGFPRSASDFFKGQATGIDADTLLAALGKSYSNDPRIDSYVKLQLLSAVDKFDAAHAKAAVAAFVNSPALVPLPICSPQTLQTWDRKASSAKESDVAKINQDFQDEKNAGEEINTPMIAYRNALQDKITTDDTTKVTLLEARVEELSQRAAAGIDTYKLWASLATEITKWSALANKKQITEMNMFLREYTRRSGPTVYEELKWVKGKRPHADWKDHKAALDVKRLETVIAELTKAANNAL